MLNIEVEKKQENILKKFNSKVGFLPKSVHE